VQSNGAGKNGIGAHEPPSREAGPAPQAVQDLAEACVRFVERAIGLRLDYEPETLSILDHYLEQGRSSTGERPEAAVLVAHAAGAYFGEVVRRRYPSWWRVENDEPAAWRLEFALGRESSAGLEEGAGGALDTGASDASERFELEEVDQQAVSERLADLPMVSEAEFYATTTRLEVIDIIVDTVRARRIAEGNDAEAALGPQDYEP
jgi:hypothetical protein